MKVRSDRPAPDQGHRVPSPKVIATTENSAALHATPAASTLPDASAPAIAREGLPIVAIFVVVSALLGAAAVYYLGPAGWAVVLAGVVLTGWCVWFFRDPARSISADPDAVVSPADGRVVYVGPSTLPPELGLSERASAGMRRVSIFMNVFDVHVNRAPVTGLIVAAHDFKGKFFNAALDKASVENERFTVVVKVPDGRLVVVTQIAGLVARRIVKKVREGERFERGRRYGLIRFGSRVDVFFPPGSEPTVRVGDRTLAGSSVIGRLGVAPAPGASDAAPR